MAVYRCNAAQAFSPANGVLDLDAPTGMRLIGGALGLGQGRVWILFAAPGLAVGQALGSHAIVGDEAQVAQIGQHLEQVKQAQVDVELLFEQLIVVGGPVGSGPQIVNVARRVGDERILTGGPFLPE